MRFDKPGTLSTSQVYSVTPYFLFLGRILPGNAVLAARSLPKVRMPNRNGSVSDPRTGWADEPRSIRPIRSELWKATGRAPPLCSTQRYLNSGLQSSQHLRSVRETLSSMPDATLEDRRRSVDRPGFSPLSTVFVQKPSVRDVGAFDGIPGVHVRRLEERCER
jgi:hypothetical protein